MKKLADAVRHGDLKKVKSLIKRGEDVIAVIDEYKLTLLHLAAAGPGWDKGPSDHKGGYAEIVTALIEAGADVNAVDRDGKIPLHRAAGKRGTGYSEIVKVLLEAGCDPNVKDKFGETPLHQAAMYICLENARQLLAGGANINAKTKNGSTALDLTLNNTTPASYLLNGRLSEWNAEKEDFQRFLVAAGAEYSQKVKTRLAKEAAGKEKLQELMETDPKIKKLLDDLL